MSALPSRLLIRDEGLSQVSLIETAERRIVWQVPVPTGRHIFLADRHHWVIGTESGYEVRFLADGTLKDACCDFPGNLAIAAAPAQSMVVSSISERAPPAIRLQTVRHHQASGNPVIIAGRAYARLITVLPAGGYLVTSNRQVLEISADGSVVWEATVAGHAEPHCWQALRRADGSTLLSCGYAANLQLFDPQGRPQGVFSAPGHVRPFFFAGLELLPSGHVLVANWQGHGTDRGASGHQVLLFDSKLNFAEAWQQDPTRFSSIQGVAYLGEGEPAHFLG